MASVDNFNQNCQLIYNMESLIDDWYNCTYFPAYSNSLANDSKAAANQKEMLGRRCTACQGGARQAELQAFH